MILTTALEISAVVEQGLGGYDKYADHQDQIHVAKINVQMFQNSQYTMTCKGWSTILGDY